MANNKVLFGFSDLYIGTYEVGTGGTVTMGTPYHQAGAVGFAPEMSDDRNDFWADNIAYYSNFSDAPIEGDLEVAMFDDTFKTQFLGYRALADGGLALVKGATKPNVYIAFEIQGDQEARRVIFYNGTLGNISRPYATIEETAEPQTATLPTSFAGDNATGVKMAVYKPGDSGYDTLFTAPSAPAF